MRGFLRILGWTWTQKSSSIQKMREFLRIPGRNHKNMRLCYKICEKTVLAHEFQGDNQYLGSLRPRPALQWHRACYLPWDTIFAWGAQFSFGGPTQWFGKGHGPGLPPVASGLLQVYNNLSYCNYRIFVKEILLEIDFIKEMRTIWGNKEVPQTFFHNFLYLRKYDVIRLTTHDCQPCIRNFVTLQKA